MTWNSDHLCLWRHISVNSLKVTFIFQMMFILSMKIIFVKKSSNRKSLQSRKFSHATDHIIFCFYLFRIPVHFKKKKKKEKGNRNRKEKAGKKSLQKDNIMKRI